MSSSERVKEILSGEDPLGPWLELFDQYRIGTFQYEEVITGVLRAGLDTRHVAVVAALDSWEGRKHTGRLADGRVEVALVRPFPDASEERWGINLVLFSLTVLTTLTAGALLQGVDPLGTEVVDVGGFGFPVPTTLDLAKLGTGVPFSLTLLGILLAHEMGHYLVARYHGVRASLPYFIPFPATFSVVGTFGAFLRIRGPAVRRSVLFDIGIAGPIASFVPSAVALAIGLSWSTPSGFQAGSLTPFLVRFADQSLGLGSSLFAHALAYARFPMVIGAESILLHPVAFAGWVGLLLTSLNLLPFGQLDGGHVAYSLFESGQKLAARVCIVLLIPLGLLWWGWWLWGAIVILVSRGRLGHPSVLQPAHKLDRTRLLLGIIGGIIFVVTFIPLPLSFFS
jgi:membrane-associated protease RseP (regulator of RpoE activity)